MKYMGMLVLSAAARLAYCALLPANWDNYCSGQEVGDSRLVGSLNSTLDIIKQPL